MSGENVAKGTTDRISELPEFILHTILSMLDTKEACRASVLSKRWFGAWSSIPVLDFQILAFSNYGEYPRKYGEEYDDDTVERFVGYIDKIMERYFTRKYRITEMQLDLPKIDEKIKTLLDKWIMIAVQNQIQRLQITFEEIGNIGNEYRLPKILFCAKSLTYLKCQDVILPVCETMELFSLKYLILKLDTIDDDMLQIIISSCPLVELDITFRCCFKNISIPWMKKVNGGVESRGSGTMQSKLQEYPLQKFVCCFHNAKLLWTLNMNVVALKNLRELVLECVPITDDIVSKLSYGLVVLESLKLRSCYMLKCINISSNSLKQLQISGYLKLMKATIDAPKLVEFVWKCEVKTSLSVIRALDHCNAQFYLPISRSPIASLVKLKKFLFETNIFKSGMLWFTIPSDTHEIVVEEEQLRNLVTGVPYKLRELKLRLYSRTPTKSSVLASLNGLFWCCRPNLLSIELPIHITDAAVVMLILSILQEKAECCKDPLKSMEVESINSPIRLRFSPIRLRLSW